MSRFTDTFRNIFKIHELRQRIIYTLGLLIIVRVGSHLTLPGIDSILLSEAMKNQTSDNLFGLYDLFVGGAFSNAAIFALGIMPYISASIIIQLLGAVVPYFQKLQQEGEEGRKKITQLTRYGTVLISAMQAWGVTIRLYNLDLRGMPIIPEPIQGMAWTISTIIILTAGTVFMMWLGEQITERGIGNGISLIIFIGIINRFPFALLDEYRLISAGTRSIIIEIVILILMVLIIAGVVLVTQGTRRIPVQYAKRVVGRKVYGGVTQYIPLRVNTAGVMPIIFALSILLFPQMVLSFLANIQNATIVAISNFILNILTNQVLYAILYFALVFLFTYFYTAITFDPDSIATNLQKSGAFVPGIRPGKTTSEYITKILTRITFVGALFLGAIAVLPLIMQSITGMNTLAIGGTALLIVVSVVIDLVKKVDAQVAMREY